MTLRQQLSKLRKSVRQVSENPSYSPAQKRHIRSTLLSLSRKKLAAGKQQMVTHTIFGHDFTAIDYSRILFLFHEVFVNFEYGFPCDQPAPKILDCGANIGMATLFFKVMYPDSEVIAVEPNPHAFEMLQQNVGGGKFENVTLLNCAVSDTEGTIDLYLGDDPYSMMGSINPERGGPKATPVACKRASEVIGDKHFDFVKIDIEGAETFLIEDLHNAGLLHCTDRYAIEYHHQTRTERAKLSPFLARFEEAGYDYVINATGTEKENQDILLTLYRSPHES